MFSCHIIRLRGRNFCFVDKWTHFLEIFLSLQRRNLTMTGAVESKCMKVTILGAAGRTGRCLSLFLKQSYLIDELSIYDKTEVGALALELNHINTKCKVSSSSNNESGLKQVLNNAKIVIITANDPYDKKKNSKDVLQENAKILLNYIPNMIKYCPRALVALSLCPVNYLVPLTAEIYKKHGVPNYNRLFGIMTLNSIRANTFASDINGYKPESMTIPIIGGNCPKTCIPVFSQTKPSSKFTQKEMTKLTDAVRTAEDEVATRYEGKETSSLAMGFACARFCISLCKALRDRRGIVECAYVRSSVIPEVTYFAGPLELGPCGIQKHLGVPPLTDQECKLLALAIPHLKEAIKSGEALALALRATSTKICPPDPDLCKQEIYNKTRKANNIHQTCSTEIQK